jgi:photosystem II stability/assembly factor-like uncharacterized protein
MGNANWPEKPSTPELLWTQSGVAGLAPLASLHLPSNYFLEALFFLDRMRGWVVVRQADVSQRLRLFATRDGAQTWIEAGDSLPSGAVQALQFITPSVGWLLTANEVWRTLDGGASWGRLRAPGRPTVFRALALLNPQEAVVGGWGAIYGTDDAGNTWSRRYHPVDANLFLFGLHFPTVSDGWAVGEDKHLLHTSDRGHRWHRVSAVHPRMGPFDTFTSVRFISSRVGVVAGTHDMREGVPPTVLRKTSPTAFAYTRPYVIATFDGGRSWMYHDVPIPIGNWTQAGSTLFGIQWSPTAKEAGIVEVRIKE